MIRKVFITAAYQLVMQLTTATHTDSLCDGLLESVVVVC